MSGAHYGRKVQMFWNNEEIEGVREKGLQINGEAADVGSDEDDGFRVLLEEDAEKSIDVSLSGVSKSPGATNLKADKLNGIVRGAVKFVWPNGDELSFAANIAGLEFGNDHNEASTFSGTLQSSGEWTYTAGAS